jgi:hypothetical protein
MRNFLTFKKVAVLIATLIFFIGCGSSGKKISKGNQLVNTPTPTATPSATPTPTATPSATPTPSSSPTSIPNNDKNPLPF